MDAGSAAINSVLCMISYVATHMIMSAYELVWLSGIVRVAGDFNNKQDPGLYVTVQPGIITTTHIY